MNLFQNYDQYIQQHGDETGIIQKRREKWEEYKEKGITLDYVSYSPGNWLHKILTCGKDFKWSDHERIVFVDRKPALIISEPYYLSEGNISELIKSGNELGFSMSLNDSFANHMYDTCNCIEIAPLKWFENQIELKKRL